MTNVLKALAAVQGNVECVAKEKKAQLNYQIVSYDGLLDLIRDDVLAQGLTLIPTDALHCHSSPYDRIGSKGAVHMNYDLYVFRFRLYHVASGEYLEVSVPGPGLDEGDKGPGKAITYATKGAWEKLLMLKRGLEWETDARPSEQMARPATPSAPPRTPPPAPQSKYTWDPKTWPVNYQEMYKRDCEGFETSEAIDKHAGFNWLQTAQFFQGYVKEKNFPEDLAKLYVRGIVIKMLAAALCSAKHAAATVRSVKEHQDVLREILGNDAFDKLMARAAAEEAKAAPVAAPSPATYTL